VNSIAGSMTTATSSSLFTQANYWRDPASGVANQVQVEYPQFQVDRPEDIAAQNNVLLFFRYLSLETWEFISFHDEFPVKKIFVYWWFEDIFNLIIP